MSSTLDSVNDSFHAAYDEARSRAEEDATILVLLADMLVAVHGDARHEHTFTPPIFHVIKSVAHAPIAIFSTLHCRRDRALDRTTRAAVERLARHVEKSLGAVDDDAQPEASAEMKTVLGKTKAFLERVLARDPTEEELDAFARDMGPSLLRLTTHATRVQLDALDACVNEVLTGLGPEQRRSVEVVVTGDHQARARSLGMQYFEKRMGEEHGAELRIAYGEGITTVDEAVALVGRRRLDVAIATSFFGDAKHLQRDVLGDAAHAALATRELARIE